jgi:transketolase
MRNTFINTLTSLAESYDDIFLLCGDLGYSVLEPFAEKFPDRYLNVGIAEQNMTQVAVGLAREGYNVFTYSIGNFPTLRCMEQIRYDVCYHEANVKIVAVGAGYAYGPQGVSHHTTEDIAMMRVMPNMLVCAPADPVEARASAHFMASHRGPGYVRINKSGEPYIHDISTDLVLNLGGFLPIRKGESSVVLTTGAILSKVLHDIEALELNCAVFSVPFIGNYERQVLIDLASQYSDIVTVEEHQLNGGFGSSILEAYSDLFSERLIPQIPRIKRIGIPNKFFGMAGSQDYLRRMANLKLPADL